MVLDLLFIMAHWHALAKLRLHTDISLDLMDDVTTALGHTLRTFEKATSSAFETHELRLLKPMSCDGKLKLASVSKTGALLLAHHHKFQICYAQPPHPPSRHRARLQPSHHERAPASMLGVQKNSTSTPTSIMLLVITLQ
jgi:hypothetical protein